MWDQVAALAPQTEQVSPLPRVTPPVPEPVVVGDVNREDVSHLSPLFFLNPRCALVSPFVYFWGRPGFLFIFDRWTPYQYYVDVLGN